MREALETAIKVLGQQIDFVSQEMGGITAEDMEPNEHTAALAEMINAQEKLRELLTVLFINL